MGKTLPSFVGVEVDAGLVTISDAPPLHFCDGIFVKTDALALKV